MRIVLDTNVLMSGTFFSGPPYRILQAWRDGTVQLAACLEILAEYRQVALRLSRKYKGIDIASLLDLVAVHAHLVRAAPPPRPSAPTLTMISSLPAPWRQKLERS